jgi:hypothetical protein
MITCSLENIFKRNKGIFLLDTSIFNLSTIKHLIGKNYLKELDSLLLDESVSYLDRLAPILNDYEVYLIPEVIKELSISKRLIKNKCSFLKKSATHYKRPLKSIEKDNLDSLETFSDKFKSIFKNSKQYDFFENFEIDMGGYNYFVEMFKLISNRLNLKSGRFVRNTSKYPDNFTDEKLCALGNYFSISGKEPCTIITKDTDFIRILRNSQRLLSYSFFEPFNSDFIKGLRKNPLSLYFGIQEGSNYSKISLDPVLSHENFNPKKNISSGRWNKTEIRQQILLDTNESERLRDDLCNVWESCYNHLSDKLEERLKTPLEQLVV